MKYFLLLSLVFSIVPWLPRIKPKAASPLQQAMQTAFFTGDLQNIDRALLIEDAQDGMNVRLEMLRAATISLDIVYYSIAPDECGQAFLGEALRAANRGVRVRILVDGKMTSRKTIRHLSRLQAHAHIQCQRYNPIALLTPWKLHSILHDKFILVDGRYLLLGGRNISNRFFAPAQHTGEVTMDRDVFVYNAVPSPQSACGQAAAYMDLLWQAEDVRPCPAAKDAQRGWPALGAQAEELPRANPAYRQRTLADYVRAAQPARRIALVTNPIHTRKKVPFVANAMKALALEAETSVVIQTPYATVSDGLMKALREIDANADTTLLTNSLASSPNFFAYSNYYSQRRRFLDAGLDIYELQSKDSIHGKSMVVDEHLSVVGSLNMNNRSFFISTESMLVIDSGDFAASLRGAVGRYIDNSLLVGPDNRYRPGGPVQALPVSWGKRALMQAFSVVSRLWGFLM